MLAFSKTIRTIAIGAIVGGGFYGLAAMYKTFLTIFADIGALSRVKAVLNISKVRVGMNGH